MSDDDLIRRGGALAIVEIGPVWAREALAALPAVTVGVKDFDVEIVRGNTGGNLALYFNDYRVAGSKPWGGGTTIHQFRVQGDDAKSSGILATIRDFQTVPVVKECLTTDAALEPVTQPAPDAAADRIAALTEQLAAARRDAEEAEAYAGELEKERKKTYEALLKVTRIHDEVESKLAKVTAAYRLEAMKRDDYSHDAFDKHLAELTGGKDE